MDQARVHSVGIVVDELEPMVDFLTGLGFELSSDTILEGPWADSILGIEDAKINVMQLKSIYGDSQIELLKYENPEKVDPPISPKARYAGQIRVFGILCANLDDGMKTALELGGKPLGNGYEEAGDYRFGYVLGPEQVIFMLAEELPWQHRVKSI
jgi:catechol 2,3-dioxygenase-like lactoylglutathione lyase family enzyme